MTREAFDTEALAQVDALYAFAFRLTRSREDAEDLVHDTLLRAFQRWQQYRAGTNIRAWMFTILYRAFVNRRRRVEAREVQPRVDESGREVFEFVGEEDPETAFYDSFIDAEVAQAITALPDEYRTAIVMSDLHGLRYGEVAKSLGVPEGTIKSRLFRGRRILQHKLRDYAETMGYISPVDARA